MIMGKGTKLKNNQKESPLLEVVSPSQWEALSRKKIYFGHQSVGRNIIEGVGEIMKSFPEIRLDMRETDSPVDFHKPLFGHSLIGSNRDPHSKIEHFKKIMENGLGDLVDIAFFKFCYVDIVADTNIEKIFYEYSECLSDLESKYPKVHFLKVTAPLMIKPNRLKTIMRRVSGKTLRTGADSLKRNMFNEALREKFGEDLFDLAKHESTSLGGDQTSTYLLSEYTDDGGHLNAAGRRIIGRQFLLFLIHQIEKCK
jgi:hypothetical protein